jgi:two-component system, chemotaxis family, protein-glutamate methylesterase/glutaminase
MTHSPQYIIVIGASAGGLHAIKAFLGSIKKGWNATVCITIHLSIYNVGAFILSQLQQHANMPCLLAENETELREDHIYLAPPDRHLFIKNNKIHLGQGAKENRWRPSIDVLFRSAAIHFNSNAAGIILSGLLNDGVSGMSAIKRSGGLTIISRSRRSRVSRYAKGSAGGRRSRSHPETKSDG